MQYKLNNLPWLSEPAAANDGMGDRKGDRSQRTGRLHYVQPELILIWLDQNGDRTIDLSIVSLLLDSKAVVVRCLPTEPQ